MHVLAQQRIRPQPRKRTDDAARPDARTLDHAIGVDHRVIADVGVADHDIRADVHAVAESHGAFEHDVHVDEHVAADDYRAARIEPRRIDERDAGEHQFRRAPLPVGGLELGQLPLVVHAQHFRRRRRDHGIHFQARPHRRNDHVGEVVLALRVVVLQLREPLPQPAGRHAHQARVAFVDRAFLRVGVLVLDDAHDVAGAVPDDAAVARRVGQHHAQYRDRLLARFRHEPGQGLELHQRHVAVEHEHEMIVRDLRHGLRHRMSRAVLLRLQHPLHVRAGECGEDLLAAVAIDDAGRGSLEAAGGVEHVPQQRLARQRLEDLRQVGVHALALAGGQDHDGEGHERVRVWMLRRIVPKHPPASSDGCISRTRTRSGA